MIMIDSIFLPSFIRSKRLYASGEVKGDIVNLNKIEILISFQCIRCNVFNEISMKLKLILIKIIL